jgi:transcription elongation GreA/GreB family factor
VNKAALVDVVLRSLDLAIATAERAAKDAREAATHDEAKPENDKDTRALELSYLAGGQASRVVDLQNARTRIAALPVRAFEEGQAAAVSALVTLEDTTGKTSVVFLVPAGGGQKFTVEGQEIQVLSIDAPLGRALLGVAVDEDVEISIAGSRRTYSVLAIE